jgi:Protein of unknown function (DUF3995)
MTRTGTEKGRSAPAASGWPAGTVTAYTAAIVAFASALMSLYWALGGHALVSTIGGYVEQFARRGAALPVLIALAATLAKLAGGLLALALVRPWGRMVPRVWLLAGSAGASALLVVYGGLTVLLGELVLLGVIHPSGSADRTALRWHVGVWDLWFLVWGSCWRWLPSAIGAGRQHELGMMGQLTEPTVNEVLADRRTTHLPDEIRHRSMSQNCAFCAGVHGLSGGIAGRAESAGL